MTQHYYANSIFRKLKGIPYLHGVLFAFSFLLFLLPFSSKAQNYPNGNEWIDYNNQYFYFPIVEEGIYRISYNAIQSSGVPLQTIQEENLQLFTREREIPILLVDENQDGQFDYIEFYAKGNDAWLDSLIFEDPEHLPNPNYSFYNDTIHYYLTWNNQVNNKRIEVEEDTDFGSYTPVDFVFSNSTVNLTSHYFNGFMDNAGVSLSTFEEGEGWFGPRFNSFSPQHQDIPLPNVYTDTDAPNLEIHAVSASTNNPGDGHRLRVSYGNPSVHVIDETYGGYQLNKFDFEAPVSAISSGMIRVTHQGLNPQPDYHAISHIDVRYPHDLTFGGNEQRLFEVPAHPNQNKSLLNITAGTNDAFIYVLSQDKKIPLNPNGSFQSALIENLFGGDDSQCYFSSTGQINTINQLTPINGSGFFTNYAQENLQNAFIIITHESLMFEANLYANHRNQRFQTMVVDAEELYHQYGGGIRKHAMAIKRFAKDLLENWTDKPEYLFLIGKAIRESRQGGGSFQWGTRTNPENFEANLVPTFGYPQSDAMFTTGLDGTQLEQAIPTGRLAAASPNDVSLYLEKIQQYEQAYDQDNYNPNSWETNGNTHSHEWKKRVLHFAGGENPGEQATFQNFLNSYKVTIQDTLTGKHVTNYFKESNAPISPSLANEVRDDIEGGVSLMTFFGHASGDGFDQNIDNPNNYSNEGKYPLLFANSCLTGNIHEPFYTSTSENYVIIEKKGVIGFLATVNLSYASPLHNYATAFYNNMAHLNYGSTVGKSMRNSVVSIQGTNPNFRTRSTCLSFTLHGDPAVQPYGMDTPDIAINNQSVFFNPSEVTSETDSIEVYVALVNLGEAFTESFPVEITRNFPNGDTAIYDIWVDGLYYRDTVSVKIPANISDAQGLNTFDVKVDLKPQIQIEEIENYTNNQIFGKELFITSGDLIPVYPYEYAIIPDNQVTLKASTGDPFAPTKNYIIEIDTTDLYNSPLKQNHYLSQSGGVVTWEPPITLLDSTVYFWRASPDSTGPNDGYKWRESSFQYIPGRRGWGQAHFFQFKNNHFNQIDYIRPTRRFEFLDEEIDLYCQVYGSPDNPTEFAGTKWRLGFDDQEGDNCGNIPSIIVAVVDPVTFEVWQTPFGGEYDENDFGQHNLNGSCRQRSERYFIFHQGNEDHMQALGNMLENEIPDGHHVLAYTWSHVNYSNWDNFNPNLRTIFQNMGAQEIGDPTAQDGVPFIFYARKGIPASAQEVYAENADDFISLTVPLDFFGNFGIITAPIAGPAAEWKSLHWQYQPDNNHVDEELRIQLKGFQVDGTNQILLDTLVSTVDSIELNNIVLADDYPYVQLIGRKRDENTAIAPQLMRWQLVNQPMPEAALNAYYNHTFHADTLMEGEQLEFAVAIENISEFDMDSMLVSYQVFNKDNQVSVIPYDRKDSLRVGEIIYDTIYFDTKGYRGANRLRVEANPINPNLTPTQYDQLEQYRFNNIAIKNFFVSSDGMNPLLDVTFDGVHILDGDIVSTNPEIMITLNDENPYLIMDEEADTANFQLWLTDPDGMQRQIYFSPSAHLIGEYLDFFPASAPDNIFKIEYRPNLMKDGEYKLLIQAQDKSGNASGRIDYSVTFEVYSTPSITEVLNYPNPFTTKTHFVFTITGSEPPDQMLIQIMTVTGRVVREITHHEIGQLRIGRNMTDFYWDGRDQFGDRLANGVYLYRVIAKLHDETLEIRETSANKYFHRGIGKMVLMR